MQGVSKKGRLRQNASCGLWMEELQMVIGERLKLLREQKSMSQGAPTCGTNMPPLSSNPDARSISSTASPIVRKYLDTSWWVTVTGPPWEIWWRNVGTTLP